MRLNWTIAIAVMTLLVGLAMGSTSSAQVVPAAPAATKTELIQELRSAEKLLVEADRDYDGHRAKAAAEVHKAIKELGGKHAGKKLHSASTAKVKPGKGTAVHEPQATSDSQLQQAQAILQGIPTKSYPKVTANVTAAITEINTALKIK